MTDRPLITIAAGLFRLANGFPSNDTDIGTKNDKGDLLQDYAVRARSGALGSISRGLYVFIWDGGNALDFVVAAGSPIV